MYILAPNGTAETYPYSIGQLRKDHPQTSFPKTPSDVLLASYDVYPVTRTEPPQYDNVEQNLTELTPTLVDGAWVQVWQVSAASPEEVAQRTADLAASVRAQRDQLLQETDWIVIKAVERGESTPPEWDIYRQALRDITSQSGFPRNVVWPSKPE